MEVTKEITDKDGKKKAVKVQTPAIGEIISRMEERGMFTELTRRPRPDYDIMTALELVEAIGKRRNPRFEIDEENRFAYANFIRWCHCDPAMNSIDPDTGKPVKGDLKKGIYIAGNTGTGKSWCLDIMQMYCRVWGFKIAFPYEQTEAVLSWNGVRADAICDVYTEKGTFAAFKTRPILAIQDFGQEPQESLYMGNRIDVIRQLIEYRGDRADQLTLITSNLKLGGQKLLDRYGDRVASRLHEMCNYFEIKGKDRRKL